MNKPYIDIDDLLFFIEAEIRGKLSPDSKKQEEFFLDQIMELSKIQREEPLKSRELRRQKHLVQEFIDLYNYYHNLLGGFEQFYPIFYDYYKSTQNPTTGFGSIYKLNDTTLRLLDKIFESNDNSFIISPPASFGWNVKNPLHIKTYLLQNKVGEFLDSTNTVFLTPGQDYSIRQPQDKQSVNYRYFLKNLKNYYNHSHLEISTNGLFNEPENDFLKQRTWLNVRETLTKERLKNNGEINSICDQIIDHLQLSQVDEQSQQK
jgi:hypothetical protein